MEWKKRTGREDSDGENDEPMIFPGDDEAARNVRTPTWGHDRMGFLINLCISIRIYEIALTDRSPNQFQIIVRRIKRIRVPVPSMLHLDMCDDVFFLME